MRFSWSPGVSRLSSSQTSTYASYGVTMKQVWVKSRELLRTRSTTLGAALPTLVTAMPEPKSISELPSTSSMTPPPARVTKTGSVVPTPGRHGGLLAREQLLRLRAGDRGDDAALLRKRGAALR